jgi:hypothetical protein
MVEVMLSVVLLSVYGAPEPLELIELKRVGGGFDETAQKNVDGSWYFNTVPPGNCHIVAGEREYAVSLQAGDNVTEVQTWL